MALNPMADVEAAEAKPSKLAKAASVFDIAGGVAKLGMKGFDIKNDVKALELKKEYLRKARDGDVKMIDLEK